MTHENGIANNPDGPGFILTNGNAMSEQIFMTWDDAMSASNLDEKAWRDSVDAAEAEDNSPVDWKT